MKRDYGTADWSSSATDRKRSRRKIFSKSWWRWPRSARRPIMKPASAAADRCALAPLPNLPKAVVWVALRVAINRNFAESRAPRCGRYRDYRVYESHALVQRSALLPRANLKCINERTPANAVVTYGWLVVPRNPAFSATPVDHRSTSSPAAVKATGIDAGQMPFGGHFRHCQASSAGCRHCRFVALITSRQSGPGGREGGSRWRPWQFPRRRNRTTGARTAGQ